MTAEALEGMVPAKALEEVSSSRRGEGESEMKVDSESLAVDLSIDSASETAASGLEGVMREDHLATNENENNATNENENKGNGKIEVKELVDQSSGLTEEAVAGADVTGQDGVAAVECDSEEESQERKA